MNRKVARHSSMTAFLAILAMLFCKFDASANDNVETSPNIELMCLTEQPAIIEGENAILRAWASTLDGQKIAAPITFTWQVDAGTVDVSAAQTRWNLASVKAGPHSARKVRATVKATRPGKKDAHCIVEVQVGSPDVTAPDRSAIRGENIFSAKRYLLPGSIEYPGYGLYSYLLFSAPPKDDEEKARYLKTIEAYLLVLQDIDDYLARHVPPSSLNATYIPLKKLPNAGNSNTEWASNVLAVYDYASAAILLSKVKQVSQGGPYLISALSPLSTGEVSARLHENLAGVTPDLAWDWVRYFTYLAAQQRSWSGTL